MKILAVCGSPRKGNTEFMLNTVLNEITNHEKELVLLREKDIKHCDGCITCEKTGECVIEDDMQGINDKLKQADVIIFGSPTYFDDVTGLIKTFLDRTNPLIKEKKLKNKKTAIITVGHLKIGEGSIERATSTLETFCNIHEIDLIGKLLASSGEKKIPENQDVINKLKQLGQKINELK